MYMYRNTSGRSRPAVPAVLAAVLAAALAAPVAYALDGTWTSNSSDNWSVASKWSGSVAADGADYTAAFKANITAARTVTLDTPRTIGHLWFEDATTASHNWVLGGTNLLTLDVGSGNSLITVVNQTATVNVAVAAQDDVTQAGAGILVLTNTANAFAAGIALTEGTLRAQELGSLGQAGARPALTLAGGTLQLRSNAATDWENNVTLTGDATINVDRLSSGSNLTQTLGTLALGAQKLSVTGANTFDLAFAGTATLSDAATFDVVTSGVDLTLAGTVTGGGSIAKTGAGALILNGTGNDYAGGTTVSAGSLNAATTNALGTGTLISSGGTTTISAAQTISGVTINAGGTVQARTDPAALGAGTVTLGGGLLQLRSDAATTWTVGVSVTADSTINVDRVSAGANVTLGLGTLAIGAQKLTVNGGNTFDLAFAGTATLSDAATFAVVTSGVDLTLAGTVTGGGSIAKTGAGALVLNGTGNDYAGGTTISAGGLNAATTNALGTGTLISSGGTTTIAAAQSISGLTINAGAVTAQNQAAGAGAAHLGAGPVTLGGGRLNLRSDVDVDWANDVLVAGSSTIDVDQLTATNNNRQHTLGGLTIGAQTLTLTANTTRKHDLAFAGTTTLTDAATFTVAVDGADLTLAGKITGAGSLVKDGPGRLILAGSDSDFAGGAVIAAGTLALGYRNVGAIPVGAGVLEVLAPWSDLGGVTVLSGGTLRLSAGQDASVGPPPAAPVAGTLQVNTPIIGLGYDGVVLADGGVLAGASSGGVTSIYAGDVVVAGGGTAAFHMGTSSSTLGVSGRVTGGTIRKTGPGLVALYNDSNSQAGTTVEAGTLRILRPGAAGNMPVLVTGGTFDVGIPFYSRDPATVSVGKDVKIAAGVSGTVNTGQTYYQNWDTIINERHLWQMGSLTLGDEATLTASATARGIMAFTGTTLEGDAVVRSTQNFGRVDLGVVSSGGNGYNLTLSGGTKTSFHLMSLTDAFTDVGTVTVQGEGMMVILDVAAANARLANVAVGDLGALWLHADQDTGAGATVPTASIQGELRVGPQSIGPNFDGVRLADGALIRPFYYRFMEKFSPDGVTYASDLVLDAPGGLVGVASNWGLTDRPDAERVTPLFLSGVLSGTGGLDKSGTLSGNTADYERVILSGANTFSGASQVHAGVLRFANADAWGDATTLGNDALVTLMEETDTLGAGLGRASAAIGVGYDSAGLPANVQVDAALTTPGQSGAFCLDAANSGPFDMHALGLRLGSSGAGAVAGGVITPYRPDAGNDRFYLGGGGGVLTVTAGLADAGTFPADVEMGTTGTLPAGRVVLAGANTYTGVTDVVAGTLQLAHADAVQNSSAINLNGDPAGVYGSLLLDPATTYNLAPGAGLLLNGGAVGWTGDVALSAQPAAYGSVYTLHLGGPESAGTMTADFVIDDVGGNPVNVVKTGAASTLFLTQTNGYTGGTQIRGGTVKVRGAAALGAGCLVIISGRLEVAPAAVPAAVTLPNDIDASANGWGESGGFVVPTDVTVTLTGQMTNATPYRGSIGKYGPGTLKLYPATGSYTNGLWGLNLFEGTFETDQHPAHTVAGAGGGLTFSGGRFVQKANPAVDVLDPAAFYHYSQFIVWSDPEGADPAARTVADIEAGAAVFISAGNGYWSRGWFDKQGEGLFWIQSRSPANGWGGINIREGTLRLGGSPNAINSDGNGQIPATTDFSLKIQNGAKFEMSKATVDAGKGGYLFGGLTINDEGTGGSVATVERLSTGPLLPITGSVGRTDWTGTLQAVGLGVTQLVRDAGAPVSLHDGARLYVDPGATVYAGGLGDLFTDTADPSRHVDVENAGMFRLCYSGETDVVAKAIGALTGAGRTEIDPYTALSAESMAHGTVDLEGTLALRDLPAAGASSLDTLNALTPLARLDVGAHSTLTVTTAFAIADYCTLTKTGPGTLTVTGAQGHGPGAVLQVGASPGGTVDLASDAGDASHYSLTVRTASDGLARFSASQHLAALDLTDTSTAQVGDGRVLVTKALAFEGGASPTATLDLTTGNAVVDYPDGGMSPMEDILGWVKSGLSGGATGYWDGPGITSSNAHDATLTAVAVIDNNGLDSLKDDLEGEPVDHSSVLIKYTYLGDNDLSGRVDWENDFLAFQNGVLFSIKNDNNWLYGDYNYDGKVDWENDFLAFQNGMLFQGGPLSGGGQASGLGSVPEPATLTLLAFGVAGLLCRRRAY
jgi:autotransporter-associated beta strand protein